MAVFRSSNDPEVSGGGQFLAKSRAILLSADFRDGNGGISRVARTLDSIVNFSTVVSYHGNGEPDDRVRYCGSNRALFVAHALCAMHMTPPNLVFCDHADVAVVPALASRNRSRLIVFLHDEEAWGPLTRKRSIALSNASLLLCNSEYTRRRFLQRHPQFDRITRTCVLGGVPRRFGSSANDTPIDPWLSDPTPYVLFVGRLWREHRYKGHLELIEAFARMRRNGHPRLRLAIVGSGNDVTTVRQRIQALDLGTDVRHFMGVDDASLHELYRRALVFILPSTREGFGLVYLEAMSCGTPCIGIRGQPAEEIIEHGISGLLLSDNSPETIARALETIQNDPTSIHPMRAKAKDRYETHFTQAAFQLRLEKAIESIMD